MTKNEQINLAKTTNDADTIELLLQMGDFDTKIALLNNPNCKELTAANFMDSLTLEDIDENFEMLMTIPSISISNRILKIPSLTIKRLLAIYNINPYKKIIDEINKRLKEDSVSIDTDDITKLSSITGVLDNLLWRINRSKLPITEEQLRIMSSTDEGKQIVGKNRYNIKKQFRYFLYKELHIYDYSLLLDLDEDHKLSSNDYIDIMPKLSKDKAINFFIHSKNIPNDFYDEEIFNAYIEGFINSNTLNNMDMLKYDIANISSYINKYSFSSAQLSKIYRKITNSRFFDLRNSDMSQLVNTILSKLDVSNIDDEILDNIVKNANSRLSDHRNGYSSNELEFLKKCKLSKEFFIKHGIYELYDHPSITTDIIADVFIKGIDYSCREALTNLSKNDLYQVLDKIFLTSDINLIDRLIDFHITESLVDFIITTKHDYGIKCDIQAFIGGLGRHRQTILNETQADILANAIINKDICKALLMCDSKYCTEVTKDLDLDTLNTYDARYLIDSKYCTVELLRKFGKGNYHDGFDYHIVRSPMCPSDILAYWAIKNRHLFNLYEDIFNNPNYDQTVNDAIVKNLTSTKITSAMGTGHTDYGTIYHLDKSPYLTREQRISLCCTPSDYDIFDILPNNLTEPEITALFKCWENSEFELPLLEKLITQPNCPTKIVLKAVKSGINGAIDHPNITPDLLEQIVDICKPKYYDSILCEKCNYNTIIKIVKNGYDDIDKLKGIIESKIASSAEDYEKFANAHLTIIDKILEQIK